MDRLVGLEWSRVAGGVLLDVVRELEVQKRRLAGVDQALLAQLGLRHMAGEKGYRDTASLLVDQLRINPVEARLRVGDAADFGPSATLGGQPLPPAFPELAAAIAAGEVSVGHARAVTKFTGAVPSSVPPGVREVAEAHLMRAAGVAHPAQVARLATGLLARLDQDGPEPREQAEQRRRGFTLSTGVDGWSKADGRISPLLTAQLNAVFDSLGAPKPADDGARDDRAPAARRHDALLDACGRLLRSGSLPDAGGAPITVLVTINETDLRGRVAETTGQGAAAARPRAGSASPADPGTAATATGRDPAHRAQTSPDPDPATAVPAGWGADDPDTATRVPAGWETTDPDTATAVPAGWETIDPDTATAVPAGWGADDPDTAVPAGWGATDPDTATAVPAGWETADADAEAGGSLAARVAAVFGPTGRGARLRRDQPRAPPPDRRRPRPGRRSRDHSRRFERRRRDRVLWPLPAPRHPRHAQSASGP
ncbi:MAG: DUF222 domain-containing protein [Actinomycetia bacterium]|nr:DUF222 domain-containing protein [Actinomycetes bacterium]